MRKETSKFGRIEKVVAGVDVGGKRKGFHAVACRGGTIVAKLATRHAQDIVDWCCCLHAEVIGVDAPCKWSLNGRARPCECELARLGITTFATPSWRKAQMHPFYGWMLNGAELFRLLAPNYRLFNGCFRASHPVCFETFPQAIACAIAGKTLSAKHKRIDRRQLLRRTGVATDSLNNIDEVDAALCALAAQHVATGRFKAYGERGEGFIVVPRP